MSPEVGVERPAQNPDGSGFPGTVCSQKTENLALVHIKSKVVVCDKRSEFLDEVFDCYYCICFHFFSFQSQSQFSVRSLYCFQTFPGYSS